MSGVLLLLLVVVVYVVVALHIDKKKTRTHVMWEGRLLRSEVHLPGTQLQTHFHRGIRPPSPAPTFLVKREFK